MGHTLLALAFVLLMFPAVTQIPANTGAGSAPAKIGAYYFDGWNPKASHLTERLKTEFANREPVWGWYDDTDKIMEQQIDFAANAGLSFWSFCWYWPEKGGPSSPLNNAMMLYLKAPNRSRLQFCLLVANHKGFRIGPKDWPAVSAQWIALFKQPTYLTVDGKPLLIFFSPAELIKAFGTPEGVKAVLDQLRADAKTAGLPGVSIAACAAAVPQSVKVFGAPESVRAALDQLRADAKTAGLPGVSIATRAAAVPQSDLEILRACGFDVLTGYNYHEYPCAGQVTTTNKEQSFSSMISGHESIWNLFAERGERPYIPVVTTGWDKRPWEAVDVSDAQREVCYSDRSPALVEHFIGKAIAWIKANPTHATPEKLILLYAWNENGEGGYLTPTKAEGSVYLDAVTKTLRAN